MSAFAVMLRLPAAMWALPGLLLLSALSSSGISKPGKCETCSASAINCTGLNMTCRSVDDVCMTVVTVHVLNYITVSSIEKRCSSRASCEQQQANPEGKPGKYSVNITCTVPSGSVRLAPSGLSLWVVLWQLVAGGFGVACISVSLEAILGLSKLICLPLYVLRSEN